MVGLGCGDLQVVVGINAIVLLATSLASGLGEVTDVTGSGSGSMIMFLFPSLLYLAIQSKRQSDPLLIVVMSDGDTQNSRRSLGLSSNVKSPLGLAAIAMVPLSVVIGLGGLVFSVVLPPL